MNEIALRIAKARLAHYYDLKVLLMQNACVMARILNKPLDAKELTWKL